MAASARKDEAAGELEVRTERDVAIDLETGSSGDVVRVLYRRPPARRWTRFLLVPDPGQPLEELEANAAAAAALYESWGGAR